MLNDLINFLSKDKQHWLTQPRFAVAVLPLPIAGLFQLVGSSVLALLPLAVATIGFSRLVWLTLLPHEKKRLRLAKNELASMRPDEAIKILQAPLRVSGAHYMLQRAVLLSKAYVRNGMFIEAHAILNTVDEKSLLPQEALRLKCAWAQLFHAAGNLKEAAHRLEGIDFDDCVNDPECLLISSMVKQQQGALSEARALLEAGLDRNPDDALRMLLLNNLASVELFQNRTDAQLRHLKAALAIFRNNPRADLTAILHHNLALALARKGRRNEAREVLREAWSAGDRTNIRHVLEVLNNNLHAAREAGDQNWKREIYEEFDRQLGRFDAVSPRGQLALDVTQLRMRRNDGCPIKADSYEVLVSCLLDEISQSEMAIPESDRIAALCEIVHDLKREIETRPFGNDSLRLHDLLRRASGLLLAKREVVDVYLSELSPKLIGPLNAWHGYRSSMDKAEIYLAKSDDVRCSALLVLFQHLREQAEWLTEHGTSHEAISAWMIICDECLAYLYQLPPEVGYDWQNRYRDVAISALDHAVALLDQCKIERNHVDQMIGVAYFSLRIRNDKATAERYMAIVKKINPSVDHFATWLRDQYRWVLEQAG